MARFDCGCGTLERGGRFWSPFATVPTQCQPGAVTERTELGANEKRSRKVFDGITVSFTDLDKRWAAQLESERHQRHLEIDSVRVQEMCVTSFFCSLGQRGLRNVWSRLCCGVGTVNCVAHKERILLENQQCDLVYASGSLCCSQQLLE